MTRVLATAAALVALLLVLPGAAAGYGTSTTYVTSLTGTPPGTWADLAAAQDPSDGGASATLTETSTGGTPDLRPTQRGFDTGSDGWTSATSSVPLSCGASAAWDGAGGAPPGSIGTSFITFLAYIGSSCTATWTSPTFTWTGVTPESASLTMDRLVDANGTALLLQLRRTVRLVDVTAGQTHTVGTATEGQDAPWAAVSHTVTPSWLVTGHVYRLEIHTALESGPLLQSSVGISYDDVVLTGIPPAYTASGEVRVTGVPPGTTHTLEARVRATGEDFTLQVWNGATWDALGTATDGVWTDVSLGLSAAQYNGGTVRVRALDATPGDLTQSVLSVDHARVVATGGATVTGPASITLDPVTLTGTGTAQATTTGTGPFEVVDGGGVASGWDMAFTVSSLTGPGGATLAPSALTVTPAAPTTPNGSSLTGVTAGTAGALSATTPRVVMRAAAGGGIGTYRQSPAFTVSVPANGRAGTYEGTLTVTVS